VLAGVGAVGVVTRVPAATVFDMASVATLPDPAPVPPPSDPQAIRACVTPTLVAEFDCEWKIVLDRVKQSKDLADLHELLNKWRHPLSMEMREPGSYYRMLGKAEQIMLEVRRRPGRSGGVPVARAVVRLIGLSSPGTAPHVRPLTIGERTLEDA